MIYIFAFGNSELKTRMNIKLSIILTWFIIIELSTITLSYNNPTILKLSLLPNIMYLITAYILKSITKSLRGKELIP